MTSIPPAGRTFCAIDTTDLDRAVALARALQDRVGGVKLGMEFFTAHGPDGFARVAESGHRIFLDLKYHDIPNTVAGGVRAAAQLGCYMLTIHASGGPAMIRAAAEASGTGGPKILAVTALTSLDEADLEAVGQRGPMPDQVMRLGRLAQASGADGAVASPHEITALRAAFGPEFLLVIPGVRPAYSSADDQKRIMTPAEAVAAGADFLVIGRPITQAKDPAGAAERIADEIAAG